MKQLCLILIALVTFPLEGSLTFGAASSDRVIHSSTGLNNFTVWTTTMWVYPTTLTSQRRFMQKLTSSIATRNIQIDTTTTEIQVFQGRGTTNASYTTNNCGLTINTWWFIAATYDEADGTQSIHIYCAPLGTVVTERTYSVSTVGSGASFGESNNDLYVGNRTAATAAFQGRICQMGHWNIKGTEAQIQVQQAIPQPMMGSTMAKIFVHYAPFGTADAIDWSGNGYNGTITGATASTHCPVPLGPGTPAVLSLAALLQRAWHQLWPRYGD